MRHALRIAIVLTAALGSEAGAGTLTLEKLRSAMREQNLSEKSVMWKPVSILPPDLAKRMSSAPGLIDASTWDEASLPGRYTWAIDANPESGSAICQAPR